MKYSANFDNSEIDKIEIILTNIAKNNDLRVFRKDRKQMRYLSKDKDAFFTALYFKNNPVLIVTNVGVTDILVLTATDYGEMSKIDLERMVSRFLDDTKSSVGIDWVKQEIKQLGSE